MGAHSRRRFLQDTSAFSAGLFVGAGRLRAGGPGYEVTETKVISLDGGYHGWPTVTRRKNGDLVCVSSGGREAHVCPFGWVDMIVSHDDGESWSYPQVILDGPIDDRDAGILETDKGTLLATTFTSLAYVPTLEKALADPDSWEADRLAKWKGAHNRISAEERQRHLGCWMIRSEDGGTTWSERYRSVVNSPHGPIQLSGGRLLYPGKVLWQGEQRIGVAESFDDGRNWHWLAGIPTRDGDDAKNYHELHGVEADEGKIVVQIRNHNPANARETLQTESTDGGKTWSTPHEIGVWGLPSFLLRLNDGRLLMTYGYRREPFGNQARLSEDGGSTWSEPMTISGDGEGGDLGYPSTVQLGDDSLLTVWYEKMAGSPRAVLRQAKWRLG
ncbi:MAG: exo-alpha-sialidase [Planctomycetota bacterium]|nr:MAG: exo-alpha-sialidase [Planctomycetota bacterium]REK28522.1 MAG: exo-alpha-sialidase [Planctomycetota bacterium]